MSEANDQPADAGVGGQGNDAPADDIDTEAFDRAPAPDDDDPEPEAKAEGEEGGDEPDKAEAKAEDDDHVEVERNGQKYKVPKALEGELLMQADYTKKTTELSEARRQFEEAQTTWESQREQSRAALPEEHAQVAVLNHSLAAIDAELAEFRQVDWDAYRVQVQGLPEDDPGRLKYARLRDAYMAARDSRIDLTDRLEAATKDLSTKEAERLTKQQEAAHAGHAKLVQETGKALLAEIPGWNKDRVLETVAFVGKDYGISDEEMYASTDKRLWKLAHDLMAARAENAALKTTRTQQQTADNHAKAQGSKPAAKPTGGGGQPRDPSTPRGDGLATEEWMRRRNAQKAQARA